MKKNPRGGSRESPMGRTPRASYQNVAQSLGSKVGVDGSSTLIDSLAALVSEGFLSAGACGNLDKRRH
eukprot:2482387-Amphidinium_carterae.2